MATDRWVYLVPLIDVNWEQFAPLQKDKGFLVEPPPLDLCAKDVDKTVDLFRELSDGKCVYAIQSGTYCRKAFYEEPFLEFYRRAEQYGGETCVHTHEEIAGQGTRNHEQDHVKRIIRERKAELVDAGLHPTSYRGGHFSYMEYLTPFLEAEGLKIEFSCTPGFNEPWYDAVWKGAPFSSYYLCPDDRVATDCPYPSDVLEIPLAADGLGTRPRNYLFIEESSDEDLRRVWHTVVDRGKQQGRPQIVHMLYHTSSMHRPDMVERVSRFLEHASANNGEIVAPREARNLHARLLQAAE